MSEEVMRDVCPPNVRCSCSARCGEHTQTVVMVTPGRKLVSIDICIATAVGWLWFFGVETLASCCGHGERRPTVAVDPESVDLMRDLGYEQATKADNPFLPENEMWYLDRAAKRELTGVG